jgi:DNA polymerase III alpha subunit (gram-positive type)
MRNWISVDIETSGLDPAVHETIEVGMCAANGNTRAFSLDFDIHRADERALEVNGWGKRDFAQQVDKHYALGLLSEAFEGGALLVASPAHFDVGFLEQLFRTEDMNPPWNHRSIVDIKSYALGRFGVMADLRNAELARMVDMDTLDSDHAHSALNDAVWQAELYRRLVGFPYVSS